MNSILTLLVLFFSAERIWAGPEFISVKDNAWQQQTVETVLDVEASLLGFMEAPTGYKIAYHPNSYTAYYTVFKYQGADNEVVSVPKLLVISKATKVKLVHEYAHLVMDSYMRKSSLGWRFFLVHQEASFSDLEKATLSLEKNLTLLEGMKVEFTEKVANGEDSEALIPVIENLTESIEKTKNKIALYKDGIALQNKSPYPLAHRQAFRLLAPYSELFADALTVLYLENWSAVKDDVHLDVVADSIGKHSIMVLPPLEDKKMAQQALMDHRDFLPGIDMETYLFAGWEDKDVYAKFLPFRSFFRAWVDAHPEVSKSQVVQVLLDVITETFESVFLRDRMDFEGELKQRNLDLRRRFLEAVGRLGLT